MLAFNVFELVELSSFEDLELDLSVEVAFAEVVVACSSELVSEGLTDDWRHLLSRTPCCCCWLANCCCC